MVKWTPSQKQQSGLISRTFEFLNDELTEFQDQLDCPDEFICDFLDFLKTRWSPDSCHSKSRHYKKDNPNYY